MFQFEANPVTSKRAVNPGSFPLVCRSCGQITVDGTPLIVPEAFEKQAQNLAEEAAKVGEKAAVELAADPNARVVKYFGKVYREAYLDGFLRCLAFYHHNAKEGRLKRLRDLWRIFLPVEEFKGPAGGVITIRIPTEAFDEFHQLMLMGPVQD